MEVYNQDQFLMHVNSNMTFFMHTTKLIRLHLH